MGPLSRYLLDTCMGVADREEEAYAAARQLAGRVGIRGHRTRYQTPKQAANVAISTLAS